MTHKPLRTFISQYGDVFHAYSIRELYRRIGGARPHKMYVDTMDRGTLQVGYVIGRLWLSEYAPVERPA